MQKEDNLKASKRLLEDDKNNKHKLNNQVQKKRNNKKGKYVLYNNLSFWRIKKTQIAFRV